MKFSLTFAVASGPYRCITGGPVRSNFFTTSAAGYSAATGHGNISDYVALVNQNAASVYRIGDVHVAGSIGIRNIQRIRRGSVSHEGDTFAIRRRMEADFRF